MAAEIIDGKKVASEWMDSISAELSSLSPPAKLALIRVGDDPASGIYLRKKEEACKKAGVLSQLMHFDKNATRAQVLEKITQFNNDKSINGILLQVPIPAHLDVLALQEAINPLKDVDGFGPYSLGLLAMGNPKLKAATPAGVMKLLQYYNLDVASKFCVVVGRSNIVGKPLAQLLLMQNATVAIAHSKTVDLGSLTKQADFLFVAVGKPKLISAKMVKKGAVIVDIGMNRSAEDDEKSDGSKTKSSPPVGDVDFNGVKKKASYITPVPGGVGPMTVASLMANVLHAYKLQKK